MTPSTTDDPRVIEALRSSVLVGAAASVMHRVWRAVAASRTAGVVNAATNEWKRHPRQERRLAVGIVLVAAAVTSVGLIAAHEMPSGWVWLTPPAIAATLGALVMTGERAARD